MNTESSTSARRARLVRELADRVPIPISPMELAAVIESVGINDGVAREDYGCEDVFNLAERLFPLVVRASGNNPPRADAASQRHGADDDGPDKVGLVAVGSRGLLAFAPLALLVATVSALAYGGWSSASLFALCVGGSVAILIGTGPILAAGRRTAIYLGFGYLEPARRFMSLLSIATVLTSIVIGALVVALGGVFGVFDQSERMIFALGLIGYALLYVLVSCLTLTGSPVLALGALVVGMVSGFVAAQWLGSTSGLVIGYTVAVVIMAGAWLAGDFRSVTWPLPPPLLGPLMAEAMPYVTFGFLFSLLLLEPHVLGWIGRKDEGTLDALITLELSLTLALPPLLLATGIHDRGMRAFWTAAREMKRLGRSEFRVDLARLYRRHLARYALSLLLLSLLWVGAIEVAHRLGAFDSLSQGVFLGAIAAFCLVGLAQFECMFMLGLARPSGALVAMYTGVVVLAASGIPLAFVDFRLAVLAFAMGAAAFAVVGHAKCRRTLGTADHGYATAF